MKRKRFYILLPVAVVCALGLTTGAKLTGKSAAQPVSSGNKPREQRQTRPDPPGTIDGATNPEMIPDSTAYRLLFKVLAGRQTENEKIKVQHYLRQSQPGLKDEDINALLAAADEYQAHVGLLDKQAKEIKDRHWPNPAPDVMENLRRLQEQKEARVQQVIASLQHRLSADGLRSIERHIHERVKRRVKISPDAQSPPGGAGWAPGPAKHH